MMVTVLIATVAYVYANRALFDHTNTPWRWVFIVPLVLFHLFAIVALPFSGTIAMVQLIIVGIICTVLGVWYAISPYWSPKP